MSYRAPVADIAFMVREVAGLDHAAAEGLYGDLGPDLVEAVLEEAGKVYSDVIGPLYRNAEKHAPVLADGIVTTAPGWKEAYHAWREGGWNGVSVPEEWGGQGLPLLVNAACNDMMQAASMAFGCGPMLTSGAIEALIAHGSDHLKQAYLPKLVSGEWMGTMNLTEPQAGSDLGALRSRAERAGDGTYRIFGQKIFITYGEHDMTDNIIHLVLARLPDAPAGTRGISLFLVPKILPDGSRNDVRAAGLEHKLGIHGSPTCTMAYGDGEGAIGWLVGEENRGLACMFTMMNNARLAVGLQGVGIAERATQQALAYAQERKQGRAPGHAGEGMSPIIAHPDVKRMVLEMRSKTDAARAICYLTASMLDRAHLSKDEAARKAARDMAALLIPIAKGFSTDIGIEVASLGVQVHGGMGFIEETGAAQHLRDARIAAIYEGTNGIQAIDLVTRKLPLENGAVVAGAIARMRKTAQALIGVNNPAFGQMAARLREAVESLDRATSHMLRIQGEKPADALAGATPYARLFGVAQGAALLADAALVAQKRMQAGESGGRLSARIAIARFFAENIASGAQALELQAIDGAGSVHDADLAFAV